MFFPTLELISTTDAIERADKALYAAKDQGRNQTIACTKCSDGEKK